MQQFAALGYIEDPGADKEKAAESADIEGEIQCRAHLSLERPARTGPPLLEEIVQATTVGGSLSAPVGGLLFPRRLSGAGRACAFAIADGDEPDTASEDFLWARIKLARGDLGGALRALLEAEAMSPQTAGNLSSRFGDTYPRLLQWQNAKPLTRKHSPSMKITPRAFLGLSTVYRRLGDNQQTVDCALRAVSLLHRLPLAHFNLGVALARSGENERAPLAFETALRFQPEMVNAHRYLATIHRSEGGDPEKGRLPSQRSRSALPQRGAERVPHRRIRNANSFSICPRFRNATSDSPFC